MVPVHPLYRLFALALLSSCPPALATLSPMCCGDNFCCSVKTGGTVECWGGLSVSAAVPSGTTVSSLQGIAFVACAGKSLVAVDQSSQLAAVMGSAGYGTDTFDATLIGTTVKDVSVSFWGGAFINESGALITWAQGSTYSTSASSQSWYPASDSRGCGCTTAERVMSLTAPAGTFSTLACGGKRAGHYCCAVSTSATNAVQCFGDAVGTYTPLSSELDLQYTPHSISAGCDFICVLSATGQLGVYEHSSKQLSSYEATWARQLSLDAQGQDTSSARYVQATCGTFAVYAVDSDGVLHAWGRVFSSDVGPVPAGVDTTGTAAAFTQYVPRDSTQKFKAMAANSGFGHACGISDAGEAVCWGADYASQVTDGNQATGIAADFYPAMLSSPSGGSTSVSNYSSMTPNLFLSDPIDAWDQGQGLDQHYSYCLDIFGVPGSNTCDKVLEARSCRVAGEDTQFEYDAATKAIKATNYATYCSGGAGACLQVDGDVVAGASLLMTACGGGAAQTFDYGDCQLTVGGLCVVVADEKSTQSGLKRQLSLAACVATPAARREWTVVGVGGEVDACFSTTPGTTAVNVWGSTGTTAPAAFSVARKLTGAKILPLLLAACVWLVR